MAVTDQRARDEHDVDDSGEEPTPVLGDRGFGVRLALGGLVGFVAAFILTVERFELAADSDYVPSCSLNPVLSCGGVMESWQAALLGFPNPLIGVASFAVLTTLGVLLAAGTVLPRWVGAGLLAGVGAGTAFVVWLISQSLYDIGALCLYCMVVWAVMIPTFWTTLARSLEQRVLPAPRAVADAVVDLRVPLVLVSYAVVVTLVGVRFWDYWQTLLPFA
ncbi:vitamin K epoxide reductase family protein [Pseudokineococcus sp. 1T1Z-3]|uniref:vitamin K epoxide reductase family protein n=1 Tax=Pseudokineococcus sp. 1T1Z-3 TaxID=3132745 RepID=UPI0030B4ECB6